MQNDNLLYQLSSMFVPPKKESLRSIMKRLSWRERGTFFLKVFFPYEQKRKNIFLYLRMFLMLVVLGTAIYMDTLQYTIATKIAPINYIFHIVVLYVMLDYMLLHIRNMYGKAAAYELNKQSKKYLDSFMESIDKQTEQMKQKLMDLSGRKELPLNPISISAADIDAENKFKTEKKEKKYSNPLEAALNDEDPTRGFDDETDDDFNY